MAISQHLSAADVPLLSDKDGANFTGQGTRFGRSDRTVRLVAVQTRVAAHPLAGERLQRADGVDHRDEP